MGNRKSKPFEYSERILFAKFPDIYTYNAETRNINPFFKINYKPYKPIHYEDMYKQPKLGLCCDGSDRIIIIAKIEPAKPITYSIEVYDRKGKFKSLSRREFDTNTLPIDVLKKEKIPINFDLESIKLHLKFESLFTVIMMEGKRLYIPNGSHAITVIDGEKCVDQTKVMSCQHVQNSCYDKYEDTIIAAIFMPLKTNDTYQFVTYKKIDGKYEILRESGYLRLSDHDSRIPTYVYRLEATRYRILVGLACERGCNKICILNKKTLEKEHHFYGCLPTFCDNYNEWIQIGLTTLSGVPKMKKISEDLLKLILLYLG